MPETDDIIYANEFVRLQSIAKPPEAEDYIQRILYDFSENAIQYENDEENKFFRNFQRKIGIKTYFNRSRLKSKNNDEFDFDCSARIIENIHHLSCLFSQQICKNDINVIDNSDNCQLEDLTFQFPLAIDEISNENECDTIEIVNIKPNIQNNCSASAHLNQLDISDILLSQDLRIISDLEKAHSIEKMYFEKEIQECADIFSRIDSSFESSIVRIVDESPSNKRPLGGDENVKNKKLKLDDNEIQRGRVSSRVSLSKSKISPPSSRLDNLNKLPNEECGVLIKALTVSCASENSKFIYVCDLSDACLLNKVNC